MKTYRKNQSAHHESFFRTNLPLRRALNLAILAALYPSLSFALPNGAEVINGQVIIDTSTPGVMTINSSPNAIVNYNDFSIGSNELVKIEQQTSQSAILNRVIGQNPSEILGQLTSNGKVFLINPNGIVFGAGAVIDTQGLIASSLNLSDQDFLSGNYHFIAGSGAGNIVNEGIIRAGKDGNIILIAPQIENNGIIKSDGGSITLAAGHELTITNLDDPEIRFQIQAPSDSVVNLGQLLTEGGAISVFAGTIKHSGEINADSVEVDKQGNIRLIAQQDVTLDAGSKISANNSQGDAGTIHIDSKTGTTLVNGTIEAQATNTGKGGKIEVLGERVGVLDNARIDASGKNGGGRVLIGGDYQGKNSAIHNAKAAYVGKNTVIKADAKTKGNGGKVIVWSDNSTRVYGDISAKGGNQSGNGGFIETSGHWLDTAGIRINASAPHGRSGEWLLDPHNITIVSDLVDVVAVSSPFDLSSSWTASSDSSYLRNSAINTQLNNGTSVTIYTGGATTGTEAGNITVSADISKTSGNDATLHLKADNAVIIDSGVSISSTSNKLNTILNADADSNGAGNIQMGAGSSIISNGGNIIMGGGNCTATACSGAATGYAYTTSQREGIYLAGTSGNLVNLNSGGGKVSLKGNGLTSTGSGQYDYGVFLNYASINTAGGALDVIGNGGGTGNWSINEGIHAENSTLSSGAGNLTLSGFGGNGNGGDSGVNLTNTSLTTTSGKLQIDGTGGNSGSGNYGILTVNTALTSSTGDIILNGLSGNGANLNWGTYLYSTTVTTSSGNLNVNGTGRGSGNNNHGIYTTNTTLASGAGALTLDGRGVGTAAGLFLDSGTVVGGDSGQTGTVTLIADTPVGNYDSIVMAGTTAPKIQGSGTLALKPLNDATAISLAGGLGSFNLSATDLSYIQNGFSDIIVGKSTGTGLIDVGADGWTVPASANLTLQNAGTSSNGIVVNGPLTVDDAKTLMMNTGGTITNYALISSGVVNLLAATGIVQNADITAYGDITLTANGYGGTGSFMQNGGTIANRDTNVNPGDITINAYDIEIGSTSSKRNVIINAAHDFKINSSWFGGGTAQNFHVDDSSFAYTLPFGFTFYGVLYDTMYISSNGVITFGQGSSQFVNSNSGLISGVNGMPTIAAAWSDWVTYTSLDKDIYVRQPTLDTLQVRWDVANFGNNSYTANFDALLSQQGDIAFDYGDATAMNPAYNAATIGVSNGDGAHYTLSSLNNPTSLNNLSSTTFSYDQTSGNYIETLGNSIIGANTSEGISAVNNVSSVAAGVTKIGNSITADTINVQSTNDIIIGNAGSLTASGTGDAIILNSTAGNFTNNAGTAALTNTGDGRWLVYSTDPAANTLGGLAASFKHYGCQSSGCADASYAIPTAGNGLLYSMTPVLNVTPGAAGSAYGSAPNLAGLDYVLSGFIDGDTEAISNIGGTAGFSTDATTSSNVGSYNISYDSGLTNDLGYVISDNTTSISEHTVSPFVVNLTGTRTYNGTQNVAAEAFTIGSLANNETLTLTGIGSVFSKNVGTDKTVELGSLSLGDGTGLASNYTFIGGTQTVDITAANITLSTENVTKTYDGTVTAAGKATVADGTLFGDDTLSDGSFAFSDKNAGANKTVTVSDIVMNDGNNGGNYNISYVDNTTSTINAANITLSTENVIKTYDGTVTAAGESKVISGTLYSSDWLSGGNYAYSDKNAGTNKTVTVSDIVMNDGNNGDNYNISYVDNTTSTINAANITVTTDSVTKTYDGTVTAAGTAKLIDGTLFGNDSISGATFTYSDKHAGINKTVTTDNVTIDDGNNGGNYIVDYVDNTTSTIDPANITLSTVDVIKTYDGTVDATGTPKVTDGTLFNGDSLSGGSYAFTDPNIGTNKTVTATGITIEDGNNGGNYNVSYVDNTNSTIKPVPLPDKEDGQDPVTTPTPTPEDTEKETLKETVKETVDDSIENVTAVVVGSTTLPGQPLGNALENTTDNFSADNTNGTGDSSSGPTSAKDKNSKQCTK